MKYILVLLAAFVLVSCTSVSFSRKGDVLSASFRIKDAQSVSLYSSTDGYQERKAVKDGSVWLVDMPASETVRYFVKADGQMYAADCPMKENDGFGGQLCIYKEN